MNLPPLRFDCFKFSELKKEDLNQLYEMSLPRYSRMKNLITWHLTGNLIYDVLAVRCFQEQELCGWGYIELKESYFDVGVFVKPNYRRRKIGSLIIEKMKQETKNSKELISFPFDNIGTKFFESNNIKNIWNI